ncbi:uncharacterized protein JCM15063_000854 [Sporobolomyces koalae]|uniref:uncharacterized protein n=1 Tax=Sporobolomyces koalae TaxID=500713 RepID=UPI00316CE277
MQTLSIRTDFPSIAQADFSVLPSPSTFFFSSAANLPSPTFDQYPISATDYHEHFLAPAVPEEQELERPELSSSSSSTSSLAEHRSPSPASSFPSTPTGSPIPQNLRVEVEHHKHQQGTALGDVMKTDSGAQFEHLSEFAPARIASQHLQFATAAHFDAAQSAAPPPSGHLASPPQPQQPYSTHVAYPTMQAAHFQGAYPAYPNPEAAHQQLHALVSNHSMIPYSSSLGLVAQAFAVPHPAPPPAAIETPHGTYYFVPNVNAASTPAPLSVAPAVAPAAATPAPAPAVALVDVAEPIQLPTPPAVKAVSPPLKPSTCETGFVQLANGLTAGVAIAQARTTGLAATGPTATVIVGDQKIRLPVGQGKRGSTKRPAKKDQVKRFICPHPGCGRAFARNFNMQSHHKSHLGIREFTCPHCPKKFSRRHDRARHCSAVHDAHVDRDGNISGLGEGHNSSASVSSGSPSASHCGDHYDDTYDEDKDFQLVDFAG